MELSSLGFLFLNNIYGYFLFFLFHSAGSFLLSIFLYPHIPNHLKGKRKQFIFITSLIIASTSFIGFIYILFVYLFSVRRQSDFETTPIIQISHRDYYEFPDVKRSFGESSATKLEGSKNFKIRLLSVISEFKTKDTLAVVKKGIAEEDDEVRLTSFSIMNKFTTRINNQIKIKLDEFDTAKDEREKGEIAKDLAKYYWELIYYGLSDEELEKYVFQMIEKYTDLAINITRDDPEIVFLKGKLYLYRKDLDLAEEYFLDAILLGYDKEKIYPYMAEVYFYKNDYKKTRELIKEISFMEKLDPKLQLIMSIWKTI